jgi:hypothetical protein
MSHRERPPELEHERRVQALELENAALRAQLATMASAGAVAPIDADPRAMLRRRRWIGRVAQLVLIGVGIVIGAAVFGDERRDFVRGFRDGFKAGADARQSLDGAAPNR